MISKIFIPLLLTANLTTPVFAGTVDTAQRMLNQLGFNTGSVDGLYGKKTHKALGQFYESQNSVYDGVLDENELNDLRLAASSLNNLQNYDTPASMDYSTKWDFSYQHLQYLGDHEEYRLRVRSQIHSNNAMQDLASHRPKSECRAKLFHKATFNVWHGSEIWSRRDTRVCMGYYYRWVLTHYEHQLKPDYFTKRFWDQLPVWIENQAFVIKDFDGGDWGYSQDEANNDVFFTIARAYYTLGDYYGVQTPERDAQMLDYWKAFMAENVGANVRAKNVDVCLPPNTQTHPDLSEVYPVGPGMSTGLCANGAARFAYHLGLAGLYHKNSDFINEAVWVASNIANGANEEGATHDALRGGNAPHYLSLVSIWLDMLAQDLEYYFGYNLYEQTGQNGVTVGAVIRYGHDVWMDPSINHKYAVLGEKMTSYKLDMEPQGLETTRTGVALDKLQSFRVRQLVGSLLREETNWSHAQKYDYYRPMNFHHRAALHDVRYHVKYEDFTYLGALGQIERFSVEGYRSANCKILNNC